MLDVTKEINVSYKIYCYSDKITVEKVFVENKGAVGDNEIMMTVVASD